MVAWSSPAKSNHFMHLKYKSYDGRCGALYLLHRYTLTHWVRVTHICFSKLTIISSDNGLSPGRLAAWWHQTITETNNVLLPIGPLETNFSKFHCKYKHILSRKCIQKCYLQRGSHFVQASTLKRTWCHLDKIFAKGYTDKMFIKMTAFLFQCQISLALCDILIYQHSCMSECSHLFK